MALAARTNDVPALTEALVRAPSPNPPGDERAAAAVVEAYLRDLPGVRCITIAARPERPNLVFVLGSGRRTLALAAHVDTHPIVGDWTYRATGERLDERLYGRGTTDNKGAVAAMAAVFRAAAEHSGILPGLRLVFIANADEELGGADGIAVVLRELEEPLGAVVVAEPSGIDEPFEALYTAARGTSRFTLTATGTRTHSSLAGRPAVPSAIERLDRALHSLERRVPALSAPHPQFGYTGRLSVVRLSGGEGYGVVPMTASAELELRVTPGLTQETIERDVIAALQGEDVELAFAESSLRWMAPSEIEMDHPLTRAAERAWLDVIGQQPERACFPGGTDARLFSEQGVPALAGVGPGALVRAHHPDEYVTVAELDTAARLYAATVSHYASERGTQ